ncbi:MAG TPA: PQQ-dependent sugar dehydrogenase [Dyella sp.]|uniref:PQQ-dependent sugar dehydrogenase n=1 Tax=Dyella sp. TaxID=1869338 RepID=UPI002CAD659D|nr:PQQ-dependent sugar dehydrogenase [Dyella sp.]HUB89394.1 PQQ-dependent sugar dehydrogenase [Dyella sp.]
MNRHTVDGWHQLLGSLMACAVFALGAAPTAHAHENYQTSGTCGGYPRVDLQTAPGTCVGLVAQHLGFPRGVATLGNDIYVVDNGDWVAGKGRLFRLRGNQHPQVVLSGLDRPNAIIVMPNKRLLIGLAGRIISVDPEAADPAATSKDVVVNLPTTGRHPLPSIALAPDGSLYINVGSASDNCDQYIRNPSRPTICPETQETPPRGSVLRAKLGADNPLDAAQLPVFARGLRNSMALVVSPNNQVIDAVNARDAINAIDPKLSDDDLPHDTLDYLIAGADYGWPYCFDNNRPSPENAQYDCSKKAAPTRLLPPHAAPLGMLIYHGHALPGQRHHLIIGYHGYRDLGHRIVSLDLDEKFRPRGEPQDLVWGWSNAPGDHPMGSPVALAEMQDGSVLVTEDRNGTLLRIAPVKP